MNRGGDPVRLSQLLPDGLRALGPKGLWTEARLRKVWREAVGEQVAAHANVRRLRGGTLEVSVTHGPWETEIRYLSTVIADKLNALMGEKLVERIEVRRSRRATE